MAMKSLMYYVVFMSPESTPTYRHILNVFWRGLCVETSDPRQFCRSPDLVTMTHAALVLPLVILIVLFVPTMIYVISLSAWNAKKGMRVIDHAILFIFPIFTNLYFNFKSNIQADTSQKSVPLECRARARSHSAPNISKPANKAALRKRFCTFICLHISMDEHFEPGALQAPTWHQLSLVAGRNSQSSHFFTATTSMLSSL